MPPNERDRPWTAIAPGVIAVPASDEAAGIARPVTRSPSLLPRTRHDYLDSFSTGWISVFQLAMKPSTAGW